MSESQSGPVPSPNSPDARLDEPTNVPAAETEISAIPAAAASAADTSRVGEPVREDTLMMLRDAPVIPGYELLDVLGRGGMGIVYLAEQMSPRRIVALKTIIAGPLASPALSARFRREIEAVARVPHPHIISLFEIGEHQGHPYFPMEYLGGGTLADRIHEKRFSGDEAAAILVKLARAVHSAHQFGFVHRDLKPSNILFTAEGTPKIADFGLVKWLTEAQDESPATRSGEVMGTLSYMSPEQACGNSSRVDATSDVYSLGVILYEMLTGRCPFVGNDLITQILNSEVPSPAWLCPGISRDLERICLRALRKDSKDRYQTAEQFALDLERYLRREPIDKPSVWYRVKNGFRRQWKLHRRRLLTIAAAVCLVAATATWALTGYLYRWENVRYFNNFSLQWLQVVGQGELSAEEVASRFQSYEVVTRGRLGPVKRVTVVGPDGLPSSLNRVEPFLFDIRDGLPTESREVMYLIEYDEEGRLVEQNALDGEGKVIWQFLADYSGESPGNGKTVIIARYLDAEGNDIDTPTGASRIRMTLDEDGWIERVDFLSGKGTPAASTQGYFGFLYAYDDEHQIIQQTFIDPDGRPMLSRDGVAGLTMSYDDARGWLTKVTYFDTQGQPTSMVFGLAAAFSEYDEFGNMVELRGESADGSRAVLGDQTATSAVSREVYGFEDGVWRTYTGYTVSDEVVIETSFDYDEADERIVRTTRQYAAPGDVEVGLDSMLDFNYLHLQECSWGAGSRATGDTLHINYERDEFGRVVEERHFDGMSSEIDESSRPFKVVEYEYEFGRLSSQTVTTHSGSAEESAVAEVILTEFEYDDAGRRTIERSYHGGDADPAALFIVADIEYDRRSGRRVRESYHADENRSIPYHDPDLRWSKLSFEYDSFGRLARHIYSGFPEVLAYSRYVQEFDPHERIIAESFWKPADGGEGDIVPARGPAGWERRDTVYDEFGLTGREETFGHDPKEGYAQLRIVYNGLERTKEYTYWNGPDTPARHPDGNHSWIKTFLEDGTLALEEHRDFPVESLVQSIVWEYDQDGRKVSAKWLDKDGNPARNHDGYQGELIEYWPNGFERRYEMWGWDIEEMGYPSLVMLYDEQGREFQNRAEDGHGNLFVPEASYAIDEFIYEGDRRVEHRRMAFDPELFDCYQTIVHFDELQREILVECLDENGVCIPSSVELVGRTETIYDDETSTSRSISTVISDRVGADQRVIVLDEDDRPVSEEYFDSDGNLVTSRLGFARAEIDYSVDPPAAALCDAEGNPVTCEVRIDFIFPGDVAEARGLLVGDIVLSYAGVPVSSRHTLKVVQDGLAHTTKDVSIVVRRDGEVKSIDVSPGRLGLMWWEQPVSPSP